MQVGFKNYLLTDDGKTAISQAVRVNPDYRRQGINAVLSRESTKILQRRQPDVLRVRFAALLPDVLHKQLLEDPGIGQTILQVMVR